MNASVLQIERDDTGVAVSRSGLTETAVGKYRYKGYEQTPSVEVVRVMLPGQPEYDGGVPGISFRWLKRRKRTTYFFVCNSVEAFFRANLFSNLERVP